MNTEQSPEPARVDSSPSKALARRDGGGAFFDRIAHRYDLLNRVMTFGVDGLWRRRLVRALFSQGHVNSGDELLDVATGTADVAISTLRAYPQLSAVGLDPSAKMLAIGHEKLARAGLTERCEMIEGDAQALPFDDGRFSASCIAFGIRNVPDRLAGLREMARVTRRGGRVVVLELSHPRKGLLAGAARFYIDRIIPRLGAWISGDSEYRYLAASIAAFPAPDAFSALMEQAGLHMLEARRMHFGSVVLFVG
ncbi:MAG: ubiquinone/menaquinone biosynthesis methyltransferase, partial [Deltaproteobacteria bacterium]|nr:ubiquinone/menaquinone biosynthesis methyltransferase [Deltaproteobacteria bacterium]